MNQEPITSLKGIGEKTGALFQKLGFRLWTICSTTIREDTIPTSLRHRLSR